MNPDAKLAADTLRKMADFKQMLAFPYDTGKIINACADLIESLAAELEQVTRERDAAVEDIERAESAAEDMRHLLDTDVHPNCDYGLYMSLHDALSDIVAWNHDVSRGTKEDTNA